MRILLTNNQLGVMGGTETWVLTMARYLSKEHTVGVYTRQKGFVSDLLAEYIDDAPQGYDLALINHNTCIGVDAKRKVFTTHGTVPYVEKPMPGCDVYVAVNENTAKHHNIDRIIRNPIDTERFAPTSTIGTKPNRILSITSCEVPFPVSEPNRETDNMPDLINENDLVISLGRGVLEAMACARNVIVWDDRGYWKPRGDGYMDNPSRITGYTAGQYASFDIDWQEEIAKYDQKQGVRNREYIVEHHNVKKIAEEYLRL